MTRGTIKLGADVYELADFDLVLEHNPATAPILGRCQTHKSSAVLELGHGRAEVSGTLEVEYTATGLTWIVWLALGAPGEFRAFLPNRLLSAGGDN